MAFVLDLVSVNCQNDKCSGLYFGILPPCSKKRIYFVNYVLQLGFYANPSNCHPYDMEISIRKLYFKSGPRSVNSLSFLKMPVKKAKISMEIPRMVSYKGENKKLHD